MAKIVRYEFMGSLWVLLILFLLGLTLPFACVYFVESLIRIEEDIADPEAFVTAFRSGKVGKG